MPLALRPIAHLRRAGAVCLSPSWRACGSSTTPHVRRRNHGYRRPDLAGMRLLPIRPHRQNLYHSRIPMPRVRASPHPARTTRRAGVQMDHLWTVPRSQAVLPAHHSRSRRRVHRARWNLSSPQSRHIRTPRCSTTAARGGPHRVGELCQRRFGCACGHGLQARGAVSRCHRAVADVVLLAVCLLLPSKPALASRVRLSVLSQPLPPARRQGCLQTEPRSAPAPHSGRNGSR